MTDYIYELWFQNMNSIIKTIIRYGVVVSAIASFARPSYGEQRFHCDETKLSTVVDSHWGEMPMIRWTDDSFPPPYTPAQRCQEVTARFNTFNNNGTLKYMSAGYMNNLPVICVAGYKGGSCLPNGLLITLRQGRDPNITLKNIIHRNVWATSGTIELSDRNSDGLVSEVDGTVYVDIDTLVNGKEQNRF